MHQGPDAASRHLASLDRILAGHPPAGDEPDWLRDLLAHPLGRPRGLGSEGLPDGWRDALSRAGVPLAPGAGDLRWGRDLDQGAGDLPVRAGSRLLLPPPARLAALGSLALRPLREAVALVLGLRLKTGAGVHMRCWERAALLVSTADIPLGGFLSGPRRGSRAGVMLAPGAHQVVPW